MIKWLMSFGAKRLIRELDILEPFLAAKIKEGQARASQIPPTEFAKELVDSIQTRLCLYLGLDPVDVLK